jgi:hypothetical protein
MQFKLLEAAGSSSRVFRAANCRQPTDNPSSNKRMLKAEGKHGSNQQQLN